MENNILELLKLLGNLFLITIIIIIINKALKIGYKLDTHKPQNQTKITISTS